MTQPPPPPPDDFSGSQQPHGSQQPYGSEPYPARSGTPGMPVGYANSEEKTWSLLAHFGGAVTGFIAPLVVFLVKGPQSPTVRAHSVAALNFQIVCSAALIAVLIVRVCAAFVLPDVVSLLLSLVWFAVWIGAVVFGVIGGLRANEGRLYEYPIQVSLVK